MLLCRANRRSRGFHTVPVIYTADNRNQQQLSPALSSSSQNLPLCYSCSASLQHFLAEMRLPCTSSRALRGLRTQLAFPRNGQRHHSLHTKSYDAAVIGGGITGLTAAFRLSQDPTCSKVTLYEKSHRVGGWLLSETIPVEGGKVVFEYGPRTLRTAVPACLPLLDLVSTENCVMSTDVSVCVSC